MPKELNERDSKLVQWLQEAHTKESELEAALTAHINLTEKMPYKKRLRAHLTETRDHKRRVTSRIKQLGGTVESSSVTDTVAEVAGKTVAAVKGQVGALRAALTDQAETHLRNVHEELREEHVEIALYSRIETFATEVGDRDTARLAAGIRREEERMAKYLNAELARLVKDVVRAEVPKDQRRKDQRRQTASRSRSRASGSRSAGARSSRSAGARSSS